MTNKKTILNFHTCRYIAFYGKRFSKYTSIISIKMAKNGHVLIFVARFSANLTEVETIFDGMLNFTS